MLQSNGEQAVFLVAVKTLEAKSANFILFCQTKIEPIAKKAGKDVLAEFQLGLGSLFLKANDMPGLVGASIGFLVCDYLPAIEKARKSLQTFQKKKKVQDASKESIKKILDLMPSEVFSRKDEYLEAGITIDDLLKFVRYLAFFGETIKKLKAQTKEK